MGIGDIFKKVTSRIKTSVEAAEEKISGEDIEKEVGGFEEPLEEEKTAEAEFPEVFGKGHEEELEIEEEEKPKKTTPKFEKEEFEEEKEEEIKKPPDTEGLKSQLDIIKTKLDLVETHLQNIESKEEMHKFESDRYMQYLTFVNEKLDHLERELGEIERLIKKT